jgi:hypothetical protein
MTFSRGIANPVQLCVSANFRFRLSTFLETRQTLRVGEKFGISIVSDRLSCQLGVSP